MNDQPIFDHEKLDVYQVELSFIAWSSVLLSEIRAAGEGLYREVCDQLDRASLSSLLNTAEGNGKRQGKQRAKFFDDARFNRRMRGVSGRARCPEARDDRAGH
jgi:hypothetical protein